METPSLLVLAQENQAIETLPLLDVLAQGNQAIETPPLLFLAQGNQAIETPSLLVLAKAMNLEKGRRRRGREPPVFTTRP